MEKAGLFSESTGQNRTSAVGVTLGHGEQNDLFYHIEETLNRLEEPSLFSEMTYREEETESIGRKKPSARGEKTSAPSDKVRRRRQIDPTTCERDYSLDEIEFMSALDEYKRTSGRMFPTCSEILEVIRSLGYVKVTSVEEATEPQSAPPTRLASSTPALMNESAGENEEIVTVLWSRENRPESEPISTSMSETDEDFEYREPLLIF